MCCSFLKDLSEEEKGTIAECDQHSAVEDIQLLFMRNVLRSLTCRRLHRETCCCKRSEQ